MGLDRPEYWRYLGDTEEEAIEALKERLDERPDAAELKDSALTRSLRKAVGLLEKATGRFFRPRTGALECDGTGARRLWLPWPIVSADQDEDAADVEVEIEGEALDSDAFVAQTGAAVGFDDPRADPWIELVASTLGLQSSRHAFRPQGAPLCVHEFEDRAGHSALRCKPCSISSASPLGSSAPPIRWPQPRR